MARAPKETASESASNKVAEARARNLDLAIQQIQKDYGEGAILRMGEEHKADVSVIPTGNLLIDQALGVGGFARGRVVEIYGPESSGKTTLTLTVIAQAQKAGGLAAFIDVEHALDPNYARRLGVKMDELLVSQPSSGEEALRICETLVRSNAAGNLSLTVSARGGSASDFYGGVAGAGQASAVADAPALSST
mgnify:CR=1 FL=1